MPSFIYCHCAKIYFCLRFTQADLDKINKMKVNELKEEMSVDNAFSGMGTLFSMSCCPFRLLRIQLIKQNKLI